MARIFACDFETTVYDGQTNTEVWSSAFVELDTEDVIVLHSIGDTLSYFTELSCDCVLYYHNLKFDGSFWLDFIMKHTDYKMAFEWFNDEQTKGEWIDTKEMPNHSYKYLISAMGQWYTFTIKTKRGYTITLKDSYKLLPFTLKSIGESFKTKHQKLEMEYTGYRYAGCTITDEEMEYIKNDVLVLKEALEFMFSQGHTKLTIGSCCMQEFKDGKFAQWNTSTVGYEWFFPNLQEIELDFDKYGADDADRYVRNSYGGGWCYLVPEKANKVYNRGHTADVNSLYPSVMHSMSGSKYPIGLPKFWKGNFIQNEAEQDNRFYFIRFKCSFKVREGYLPFIHIRHSLLYDSNENLTTSDIRLRDTGEYVESIRLKNGDVMTNIVIMTMSEVEFKLFMEHYTVDHFEIMDGCYFMADTGLFDPYIDHWKQVKMTSKGDMRTLAKLFLNNLYGKLASNSDSSFKIAYSDEKGIHFREIFANDKELGYIPIGSAITSYARNFTIRTAQMNYHGANERGFIYADTDSIHCDLEVDEFINVPIHDSEFCHWKIENTWDKAIFVRQKTYIEHTIEEDLKPIEKPYYLVKCAGMPKHCKDLFIHSIEQDITQEEYNKLTEDGKAFVTEKRELTDFRLGLTVPEKLMPKRIDGGVLLMNTTYQMR